MAYNFSNVKVLIVEDSQPMTEITCALLKGFGVTQIDVAKTSEVGFQKFCDGKHDLILTDWLVKNDNGIEFTEHVRMHSLSPNPFVPIILMTGFSEKRRVIQARDTGVTEFLVKPFTANDLYKRVDHIIMKPRQFVKSLDFFGPDRRRKYLEGQNIPKRREIDKKT
jgi:DNA-binding response OmpR family regulator